MTDNTKYYLESARFNLRLSEYHHANGDMTTNQYNHNKDKYNKLIVAIQKYPI